MYFSKFYGKKRSSARVSVLNLGRIQLRKLKYLQLQLLKWGCEAWGANELWDVPRNFPVPPVSQCNAGLPPPTYEVWVEVTLIPSLDQREALTKNFLAESEDPSYFLGHFDME